MKTTDTVTITGHDLEQVEDVSFGPHSASFEVVSETTIVAQAFGFTPSSVPVTVTTRAGTVSLPAAFTFEEVAASASVRPDAGETRREGAGARVVGDREPGRP